VTTVLSSPCGLGSGSKQTRWGTIGKAMVCTVDTRRHRKVRHTVAAGPPDLIECSNTRHRPCRRRTREYRTCSGMRNGNPEPHSLDLGAARPGADQGQSSPRKNLKNRTSLPAHGLRSSSVGRGAGSSCRAPVRHSCRARACEREIAFVNLLRERCISHDRKPRFSETFAG
jgi:hypothetical protein